MKTKFAFLLVSLLALTGCDKVSLFKKKETTDDKKAFVMKEIVDNKCTVSFYYNIAKSEINLNSGLYASGSSIALKVDQVEKGSKVTRPDIDPIRKNYVFDGWHKDEVLDSPFDFENETVNSNLVLYAHWSKTQEQEDEFIEPEYVEPSKIDDSLGTLISINGVLNMPLEAGSVKLSRSAILRLEKDNADVVSCLNYMMKSGVEVVASYNTSTKKITYSATKGVDVENGQITVVDNTANLIVTNTTYENKATNYENNSIDFEDHRIMLAGSSSMENWSTSTEDLLPLKTYNHGIGGTTVDEWKNKLNQRLVYPYSPKTVVYYVGVNNLIKSDPDSAQTTISYLLDMFDDVHAHLPNTKIYWVLINALPGYMHKLNDINAVNAAAIEYEKTHDFLVTLNAGERLLKENGDPNSAYFLTDGLHMSKYGYVLWGGYIKERLIEDMK